MLIAGTVERKTRVKTLENEHFNGYADYLLDGDESDALSPQAFVVHQSPNWSLTPHYHLQEQFQLVVGGTGRLGVHELSPGSIHYATREAGYGPIVSGPEGLVYMTLRCIADSGAWYLPESRSRMQQGLKKRQKWAEAPAATDCNEPVITPALQEDGTGLAAWFIALPPNAQVRVPEAGAHAGRFHVVLGGSMRVEKVSSDWMTSCGCIFGSADERPLTVQSGEAGLTMAVLQFPVSALDPGA